MITIINDKPDPSVVKQVVCSNCGVKLEYTPADVKKDTRTDYTGGTDDYNTIGCPKCSHVIVVR